MRRNGVQMVLTLNCVVVSWMFLTGSSVVILYLEPETSSVYLEESVSVQSFFSDLLLKPQALPPPWL